MDNGWKTIDLLGWAMLGIILAAMAYGIATVPEGAWYVGR